MTLDLKFTDENKRQAEEYIKILTGIAKGSAVVCFQTFTDKAKGEKAPKPDPLAKRMHGDIDQHWDSLVAMNSRGAGVFITVNETNGSSTKKKDIKAVRAIWQEDDDQHGWSDSLPEPTMVVESSSGKHHRYLQFNQPVPVEEFEGLQARMVEDHGSDPNAANINRVLRLPGFYHLKDKRNPYLVRIIQNSGKQYTLDQIKEAVPPVIIEKPANRKPAGNGKLSKPGLTMHMLSFLDPDCEYGEWIRIGQAIHYNCGGGKEGLDLWDRWSRGDFSEEGNPFEARYSFKYDEGNCAFKWSTFSIDGEHSVSLGTLWKEAKESGWDGEYPKEELGAKLREVDENRKAELMFGDLFSFGEEQSPSSSEREKRDPLPMYRGYNNLPDEDTEWLIDEIIPATGTTLLFGESGTHKTFLVLDMLNHIVLGKDWHGRGVKKGPVVYVCGEGLSGLRSRGRAWCKHHGIDDDVPVHLITAPVAFPIPDQVTLLKVKLQKIRETDGEPVALVVDTLGRNFGGGDENATKDMNAFLDGLDASMDYKGSRIVLHHTGHSNKDREKGAYALTGAVESKFIIKKATKGAQPVCVLECLKQRDAEESESMAFIMERVDLGFDLRRDKRISSLVPVLGDMADVAVKEIKLSDGHVLTIKALAHHEQDEGLGMHLNELAKIVSNGSDWKAYSRPSTAKAAIKTIAQKDYLEINEDEIVTICNLHQYDPRWSKN